MIKAILLDKDGTILDIEKTWLPVAKKVVSTLARTFAPRADQRQMLQAMGIVDDKVISSGSMASGTNKDIAQDLISSLKKQGYQVAETHFCQRSEFLFTSLGKQAQIVSAVEDLDGLLARLEKRDLCIGLATSDTQISACHGLQRLGVLERFSFIGADDGVMAPKPDPAMMQLFCQQGGFRPQEVVMVGDTVSDMQFGIEAGAAYTIGIDPERKDVAKMADYCIDSLEEIIDEKEKLIWEK